MTEEELIEKIEAGTLCDSEIVAIIEHGSSNLRSIFNAKVKQLDEEKAQFERATGISGKTFDGIDNDGNPFKDMATNTMRITEQYSELEKFI